MKKDESTNRTMETKIFKNGIYSVEKRRKRKGVGEIEGNINGISNGRKYSRK